jgi:general stress protein 26
MKRDTMLTAVLAALRNNHFAVLSTVGGNGPHSAGVNYGLTIEGRGVFMYVMTRRHLRKARNIATNPAVSLVVPVPRRLLWFVPPGTIQLHGRAEILEWTDEAATKVFCRFWIGRRILRAYREAHHRGETRICFLRITLDPVVTTYMVGSSIWTAMRRMESAAGKIVLPTQHALLR